MKRIIVLSAIMAITSASQAVLIAYEGFDYSTGQDLSKTTLGGTGWDTVGYGAYEPGYQESWNLDPTTVAVTSGSLTAPGDMQSSTGNSVVIGGSSADATRQVPQGTGVDLSQNGASVYFSYLINASSIASGAGDLNNFAGVRLNGTSYLYISETGSNGRLRAWTTGGSIAYDWGHVLTSDTTYLVVGKLSNNNGTVRMDGSFFVDGDTLEEPATWMIGSSAAYTTQGAFQIEFKGGVNNTLGAQFDEFRLGTTFEDVVPVPEPATIGLFGLTSVALLGIRKIMG